MNPLIVYAASTCASRRSDGTPVRLTSGEAWWADDPFVIAHPELFLSQPPVIRGTTRQERPPVETATAVPGAKRRGRPPRAL